MAELKPCPVCGGHPQWLIYSDVENLVRCTNKNCGCETGIFTTKGLATKAWNTRPREDQIRQEEREKIEYMCYAHMELHEDYKTDIEKGMYEMAATIRGEIRSMGVGHDNTKKPND